MTQTVAFIGLGNMGSGMAANQVKAGRTVLAYDLSAAAVARAVEAGAQGAASLADAVGAADAVITMLPAGRHVREVYLGDDGVLAHARPGAVLMDCSTIDIDSARAVIGGAADKGFAMVDAPVSGGIMAANAGTLAFMVGGADASFAAAEPVLKPMAKAVFHAGDAGAGQAAKICNNMLLAISMIGACEAFALAAKLGLDAQRFFDIASQSSGQCWSVTTYCPVAGPVPGSPANRNYDGGFATALMLKDLKLAIGSAQSVGASTPLGSEAQALYAMFDALGGGGKDFSAIIQMLDGSWRAGG